VCSPCSYFFALLSYLRVCESRLCVLTVFSGFLLVYLFLSLSLSHHLIKWTRSITTKEEEEERLKFQTTDVKKEKKKEEENIDVRRPGTRKRS